MTVAKGFVVPRKLWLTKRHWPHTPIRVGLQPTPLFAALGKLAIIRLLRPPRRARPPRAADQRRARGRHKTLRHRVSPTELPI
jgi:hypothetical protein